MTTFQLNPSQQDTAVREAAMADVMSDVVANRLGGDARLFNRWAANNASYLKYRHGLRIAELSGKTGSDTVDMDRLRLAVAASAAGGELRRDGTVKGTRDGTTVKAATGPKTRWVPHGGALIDTATGVVMTKRQASLLGWVEGAK